MKTPPADRPLCLMHICHSCFLLRAADGALLLVDPYFGAPFRWKAKEERHAGPPPSLSPDDIEGLTGIVVTHEHPDHCQGDALYRIMSRNSCELWGPAGIYRRAVEVGIDNRRVNKVEVFEKFRVGSFDVLALPNRGSEDAKPCMRMSYVFACGGTGVFHGGDSHGPSPAWTGHVEGVPLALLWPNHIERTVSAVRPQSVALMHCDRFEPGDFLCGYDEEALRERLRRRSRGTRVLSPARGEWFWPEELSPEELQRLRERPAGRRRGRERGQPDRAESAQPQGAQAAPAPAPASAPSPVPTSEATSAPVPASTQAPSPAPAPTPAPEPTSADIRPETGTGPVAPSAPPPGPLPQSEAPSQRNDGTGPEPPAADPSDGALPPAPGTPAEGV